MDGDGGLTTDVTSVDKWVSGHRLFRCLTVGGWVQASAKPHYKSRKKQSCGCRAVSVDRQIQPRWGSAPVNTATITNDR